MKNLHRAKLNVILKKQASVLKPLDGINALSGLENFSVTRLFDIGNVTENQISTLNDGSPENREKAFNQVYDSMDEVEKKIYRIWQIELTPGTDIDEAIRKIKADPNVESVDLNELNELYFKPNDPRYDELYGLKKIECECAWDDSKGENITVAVVDTGVDYNHPDIKDNMWKDSNGNYGKDFSDNDNDPMDYHGHGTHVAGTIAAVGDNKTGIIGVAPLVKIMAVKMFPNATDDVAAKSLKYAVDNGAKVINCSWGPSRRRPKNPTIEAMVEYVYSKGGICVFAAGNSNDKTESYSPANHPKTISVAATDQNDNRAWFSNFGKKTDLAAPGVSILSLRFSSQNYVEMNGTSMSCPHVAGACALLLSKNPGLGFSDVKNKLVGSVDTISTDKPIGGRLNTCKLLK